MNLEIIKFNKNLAYPLILVLGLVSYTHSQSEETVLIKWGKSTVLTQGDKSIIAPVILGQEFLGQSPNYFWSKKVANNIYFTVNAELLSTIPATEVDESYLKSNYIEVNEFDADVALSNARNEKYVIMNLMPFVRENGVLKRISSIKLIYSKITPVQNYIEKDFVANSVLRSGTGSWYKISVSLDGIHKIEKPFLEACGIDVASLSPNDINIFGNGEGRLPESNSYPRTDDLAKNAIKIVGGEDGVFNDEDYILFHALGPHRWSKNGSGFNQDRNPYSDVSCYFINVNPGDTPLRIEEVPNSSNPITHAVSEYNYFTVYEKDNTSLVNGGQRWYGELFDTELYQSFNFSIPNISLSSPAEFEVSIASSSNSSFGTAQTYTIGGTTLLSSTLPTGSDFGRSVNSMTYSTPSSLMTLNISITRNTPDALTYLDRILLNARRGLVFTGDQIEFRDLNSVGVGNVAEYSLSGLPISSGFVWEVTDHHVPFLVSGSVSGSNYVFQSDADTLRSFVASDGVDFLVPTRVGSVTPQNLHALGPVDYLIITNKNFITQANRLAALHINNGLTVHVVTSEQVYNEFSSGMLDATAIRSFAKMFYDRSVLNPEDRPKSLLIFGDGTYDPKNRVPNNNNFMLTYQVENSENHISALVTDDYFGMLDDTDSFLASDLLDIGIGRLLISDNTMAKQQVDKVEHYMKNGSNLYSTANTNCSSDNGSSTFGDWRTRYVQIADDEEFQFIGEDCEAQYDSVTSNYPEMNCDKIYLDAFQQISTAGGERYPEVNNAINNRMDHGALVVNYVGHGGEVGVAEERVITVPQIQGWRNIDRMPLFVSATCEFTKYDDPDRVSAGEWASMNPYGAAIALMTTTRSVYYDVNEAAGRAFYANVFERDVNFKPRTFGEIIMRTKNESGSSNNKRSFTLIGDPALQIALPEMNIVTDSINGFAPSLVTDTLKALSKVTIKGHLEDFNGTDLEDFNGVVYPSVFDKPKIQTTLQNDPGAPLVDFEIQSNKLYRGKASVIAGKFEFTFIVPKDINYSIDYGKVSYYADNGLIDAIGFDKSVYVGGIDENGINDSQGPQIDIFLNDESFIDGGITDESPILIANIFDENGINAVGNGVGHDLIAILDNETGNPIVLNDYYSAELDDYQSGEIRYNFNELEKGEHTLSLKVWDVNNNSSELLIRFVVQDKQGMSLAHVLNYPNPFTTSTEFYFEHNQVCSQLEAQIQIFTVSGRLVKTINQYVHTEGFRSQGIYWNGRDDFGDQLAKGVYIYRLKAETPDGEKDERLEKLVILK